MKTTTEKLADALRVCRGTLNWYAENDPRNRDDGDAEQVKEIDALLAEYDAQPATPAPGAHAGTPWRVSSNDATVIVATPTGKPYGITVAETSGYKADREANAARIVACVNACDGLTAQQLADMEAGFLAHVYNETMGAA